MKTYFSPEELEYVILSGRSPDSRYLPYYNSLYETWKAGWQKTFEDLHSTSKAHCLEYLRQSLVTGLFYQGEAIAFHGYSFFELSNLVHLEVPYFKAFLEKAIPTLRAKNLERAMTIEYLYIDPAWRKDTLGVGLASILISLGLRIFMSSNAEVALGVTRNDRKMNDISYPKGAECLQAELPMHSVTVDLVSFSKTGIIENLVDEDKEWFESFWSRRVDTAHISDKFLEIGKERKRG